MNKRIIDFPELLSVPEGANFLAETAGAYQRIRAQSLVEGVFQLAKARLDAYAEKVAEGIRAAATLSQFSVGDLKYSAQKSTKEGWLLCEGQALNTAEYPDLYKVIGTTFGTPSAEGKFLLPDGRGRFLKIPTQATQLGTKDGKDKITLTTDNLPAHTHAIHDAGHRHASSVAVVSAIYGGGASAANYAWKSNKYVDVDADRKSDDWDSAAQPYTSRDFTNITIQETGQGTPIAQEPPYLYAGYLYIFCGIKITNKE